MRQMGLEGIVRGRRLRTTVSGEAAAYPLDRVNRQFPAPAPDTLWVSDFTYVATWVGFVHVAVVIDAYARRIVEPAVSFDQLWRRQGHRFDEQSGIGPGCFSASFCSVDHSWTLGSVHDMFYIIAVRVEMGGRAAVECAHATCVRVL